MKKIPLWKKEKPPYQIGRDDFTHKDLKKEYDGWVDAKKYLPISYDLVYTRCETKTVAGWWNGIHWEGLRLKDADRVLCWKFNEERGRGESSDGKESESIF